MNVRILPSGDRALLAQCHDLAEVMALHAALAAAVPRGVVDLVPAARTVLVVVEPTVLPLELAAAWIRRTERRPVVDDASAAPPVVIPVRYRGPDLATVADVLQCSIEEAVARHMAARWRVAFTGFAPGFAYLVSDAWRIEIPRLSRPRTAVPAGSIAVAGEFSGIYPNASPGGWQLIGSTDVALWDLDAKHPALLTPGATVRFREDGGS